MIGVPGLGKVEGERKRVIRGKNNQKKGREGVWEQGGFGD